MSFLETIFQRLSRTPDRPVLQEVRDGRFHSATGSDLLAYIRSARSFLRKAGLKRGDRSVLLAHNSLRWAALDLALMAEGIIVVPLYARQAPRELVGMVKDCSPSLICCGDEALRHAIGQNLTPAPPMRLFDEIFAERPRTGDVAPTPCALTDEAPVTIIYTSGTSGEPKGVVLNAGNINSMIPCASERLNALMGPQIEPDRVFHYLPFCFAGSWILMLTCLSRNSRLMLSTDLSTLVDEIRLAAPHYFLNVPALLERMRSGIDDQIKQRGGVAYMLYEKARRAWLRRNAGLGKETAGEPSVFDPLWLGLARSLLFHAIKRKISPHLKALICGSAPLAKETQLFFMMLGIPVLQVYGLTETTAICTMDHPSHVEPGRVGPAIRGVEMRLGESDEILVRGPNVFPGYWNRPEQTADVLRGGWFHTGDQGEKDEMGTWRIIGRIKNLLILRSGHNVAPEPIEDMLLKALPGAEQVMLVGHGRSFLAAIVTGEVTHGQVEAALEMVNPRLPHYKRIHGFYVSREPFSIENGLLTANGKLKRDAIAARFHDAIEALYKGKRA